MVILEPCTDVDPEQFVQVPNPTTRDGMTETSAGTLLGAADG